MKKDKKTILIVDDSALIMERMVPMLEEMENVEFVIHAGTYQEAIELLEKISPQFVLLDIHLPDRSGIELLRTIRERYREIIVLMITNSAGESYREICKKLGARYFFDKSKDFDQIPAVIAAG